MRPSPIERVIVVALAIASLQSAVVAERPAIQDDARMTLAVGQRASLAQASLAQVKDHHTDAAPHEDPCSLVQGAVKRKNPAETAPCKCPKETSPRGSSACAGVPRKFDPAPLKDAGCKCESADEEQLRWNAANGAAHASANEADLAEARFPRAVDIQHIEDSPGTVGRRSQLILDMVEGLSPTVAKARMLGGADQDNGLQAQVKNWHDHALAVLEDSKSAHKTAVAVIDGMKHAHEESLHVGVFQDHSVADAAKKLVEAAETIPDNGPTTGING